jgi:chromosome segregation ATPase
MTEPASVPPKSDEVAGLCVELKLYGNAICADVLDRSERWRVQDRLFKAADLLQSLAQQVQDKDAEIAQQQKADKEALCDEIELQLQKRNEAEAGRVKAESELLEAQAEVERLKKDNHEYATTAAHCSEAAEEAMDELQQVRELLNKCRHNVVALCDDAEAESAEYGEPALILTSEARGAVAAEGLHHKCAAQAEVQEVREVLTAVEAVCDEVEHGAYEARGSRVYVTERIRAALSGAPKP